MKKIRLLLFATVLSLANITVDAQEVKEVISTVKQVETKPAKIGVKSIDFYSDLMKDLATISLSEKDSVYYLGKNVVTTASKTEVNGMIKLSYTEGDTTLESWYKFNSDKSALLHVKNVLIDSSEKEFDSIQTFNFRYISSKLVKTTNLIAGNGTDNYKTTSMMYESIGTREFDRVIYYFSDKAIDLRDYTSVHTYAKVNNKIIIVNKTTMRINSKNLRTGFYSVNYSANGKIGSTLSVTFINALSIQPTEYHIKYYKQSIYDSMGRIVTISIGKDVLGNNSSPNGELVETYRETRLYYSNNKYKQKMVVRNNSYNQRVALERTRYSSDGKRTSFKKRTYKNKKIVRQYTYVYNKKGTLIGNASKTTVIYNKKGKASSAYRAKYNNKGKLTKAYKIKLTKSVVSW